MDLEEAVRQLGALRAPQRGGRGVRLREGAAGRRLALGVATGRRRAGGRLRGGERDGAGGPVVPTFWGERLEFLAG